MVDHLIDTITIGLCTLAARYIFGPFLLWAVL